MNWKRSTRCSTGACIEVGQFGKAVKVRDSKLEESPELTFDAEAWKAFITDVKWGGW